MYQLINDYILKFAWTKLSAPSLGPVMRLPADLNYRKNNEKKFCFHHRI